MGTVIDSVNVRRAPAFVVLRLPPFNERFAPDEERNETVTRPLDARRFFALATRTASLKLAPC